MMKQCQGDDWLVLQTSINWKLLRGRKGDLSPCLSYISIPTFHLEPCPSYLWVWNKFMLDNRVKVFSIKNHFMPQEGAPLILWWWFQKQTRLQGGKPPAGGVLPSLHNSGDDELHFFFCCSTSLTLDHMGKTLNEEPHFLFSWYMLTVAPPSSDHTWHVFVSASASQGIGQSCQWYGHLGLLRVLAEYSQFRP